MSIDLDGTANPNVMLIFEVVLCLTGFRVLRGPRNPKAEKMNNQLTIERLKELLHYNPDTGVFTWLKRKGWRAIKGNAAGTLGLNGYIWVGIDGRRYLAHRLAWFYETGCTPKCFIDHINGSPSDNRICNLREADFHQSSCNTKIPSSNRSGEKGVCWSKRECKWRVVVVTRRRQIHLGYFSDIEDAVNAARNGRKMYHGEYARMV